MKRRKTQKEMWEYINEPIVEKCIPIFVNGKPIAVGYIVDRVPLIKRKRRKQK
ncbi:MAG: hypothetical protein JSV12_00100 [Candidatus Bathyarchaeota archaeon]|nr:MAG: hypothetical protein JSV12_00100 [Candidatus Bathyarchaeota archaeon]